MSLTTVLLFLILALVVGADFLFKKLQNKSNPDILKIGSAKKVKTKKRFFINRKILLVGIIILWIFLLVFDLNGATLNIPRDYNYNEIFVFLLVLLFYIVFSIKSSLKKNNLDSNKNKAREVIFTVFTIILLAITYYTTEITIDKFEESIEDYESVLPDYLKTHYDNENKIHNVDENKIDIVKGLGFKTKIEEFFEYKFLDIKRKFDLNGSYPVISKLNLEFLKNNNEELLDELFSLIGKPNLFTDKYKNFNIYNKKDGTRIIVLGSISNRVNFVSETPLGYPQLELFYDYQFNDIEVESIERIRSGNRPIIQWEGNFYSVPKDELDFYPGFEISTSFNIKTKIIENPLPGKYLNLPDIIRSKNVDKLMNEFNINEKMFYKLYERKSIQSIVKSDHIDSHYKFLNRSSGRLMFKHNLFSNKLIYISNSFFWDMKVFIQDNFIQRSGNSYSVLGFTFSYLLIAYALRISIFLLIFISSKLYSLLFWSFKTYFE